MEKPELGRLSINEKGEINEPYGPNRQYYIYVIALDSIRDTVKFVVDFKKYQED